MRTQFLILFSIITIGLLGQNTESIKLDWKQKEGWKVAFEQEEQGNSITEFVQKREKLKNWTELISVQKLNIPNASEIPLEALMNSGYAEAMKNAPEAKLTLIDKNEESEYPWIEYKVEVPQYLNDPNPESQFFHVVQGKYSIFLIWWAVKKDKINDKEISEWKEFSRLPG